MENRIASTHMFLMLHDETHVFFVADMHQAARRKSILQKNIVENFNGWLAKRSSNFCDSSSRISGQTLVRRTSNLAGLASVSRYYNGRTSENTYLNLVPIRRDTMATIAPSDFNSYLNFVTHLSILQPLERLIRATR